jgi:hypothetical protein
VNLSSGHLLALHGSCGVSVSASFLGSNIHGRKHTIGRTGESVGQTDQRPWPECWLTPDEMIAGVKLVSKRGSLACQEHIERHKTRRGSLNLNLSRTISTTISPPSPHCVMQSIQWMPANAGLHLSIFSHPPVRRCLPAEAQSAATNTANTADTPV